MTKKEVLSEVLASNLSDDAKIYIIQALGKEDISSPLPDIPMGVSASDTSVLDRFPFHCTAQ